MTNFKLLKSILFFILLSLLMTSCANTSTQTPAPVQSSFSYFVHVQSDKGEDITGAEVTIEVIGKAPLDEITDSKGIARIIIDASYAGKPGRLIADANGYGIYTQHIDVVRGALPDIIRMESLSSVSNSLNKSTEKPTDEIVEFKTPTVSSNEEPTQEAFAPPTPTDIAQPADTPSSVDTAADTPVPTHTPTLAPTVPDTPATTPDLTGQLAIPLLLGTTPKVYIASTTGEFLGNIDIARQPDFTLDGSQLIVNGDGGGLDKLRISSSDGKQWEEIGDMSLGGHSHPAWSPDGTQLIYDDGTIDPAGWHIFKCGCGPREGEGDRLDAATGPIVNPHPLYPLWTTDERFIFRGCRTWGGDGGDCGIWLLQSNKGEPEKLTGSPNHIPTDVYQNMVVYTSEEGGNRNVYALNIETGKITQLTFHSASDGLATISPDGQTVAFLSNRGGKLAIYQVGINGGSTKKMFDISPDWGTLREDGWSEEKLSWGKDS